MLTAVYSNPLELITPKNNFHLLTTPDNYRFVKKLFQYDLSVQWSAKKITIQNSSKYSREFLLDILYSSDVANQYIRYYPDIGEQDANGNYQLLITEAKPKRPPYILPPGWLPSYVRSSDPKCPNDPKELKKNLYEPLEYEVEELLQLKDKIAHLFTTNMYLLMKPKESLHGIWYFEDLKAYFERNEEHTNIERTITEAIAHGGGGYLNSDFFKKTDRHLFYLKPDKSAAEAIQSIFNDVTILDCGTAIVACVMKTILEVVGKNKFDAFFNSGMKNGDLKFINPQPKDFESYSSLFCRPVRETKYGNSGEDGNRPLQVGDICSFRGVYYYGNKHPAGVAGNWNVVCLGRNTEGEQIYAGFGFNGPLTEKEIIQLLIDEYNKDRTELDLETINYQNDRDKYNESTHPFLKKFFKITEQDIAEYSTVKFLDGFYPSNSTRIEPKFVQALLKAETEEDIINLKNELIGKAFLSGLGVRDGNTVKVSD